MRLMTLQRCIEITQQMFEEYVEPLGKSLMFGEVPSISLTIHRRGTKDKDWLAHVSFKNTLSISVFKCEIWMDDMFLMCRRCKLWLLTEDIFNVVALYHMLQPLYQSQFINFGHDVESDYGSMLYNANHAACKFIKKFYLNKSPVNPAIETVVLNILQYNMQIFTNSTTPGLGERFHDAQEEYEAFMMEHYEMPYRTARIWTATTTLVDSDGYFKLERITQRETEIQVQSTKRDANDAYDHEPKKPAEKPISIPPKKHKTIRINMTPEYLESKKAAPHYQLRRSDYNGKEKQNESRRKGNLETGFGDEVPH